MKGSRSKIREKLLSKNGKLILILLLLVLINCNPIRKSLAPLSSSSSKYSRDAGLLLKEYNLVDITFLDTINLVVKEAFAEKQFRYKAYDDLSYTIDDDGFQINIILTERLSKLGHHDLWKMKGFTGTSPFHLVNRYNGSVPPDTMLIKILQVDIGNDGVGGINNKREIESFILRNKE